MTALITIYIERKTASNVIIDSIKAVSSLLSSHLPNRLPKYIVTPICRAIVENRAQFLSGLLCFSFGII